ncbi:MAG: TonB-dependent receptor, partial [Ignavibacteria bacterium]|nr:TonB-dependent receptor [Ignavibacteria bacterium]
QIKYNSRFYLYKLSSRSYYNPNNFVAQNYGKPGEGFETYISSYNFGNITQVDFLLSKRNYLISGIDLEWNIVRSKPDYILYGDQQTNNFGIFLQNKHIFISKSGDEILSGTVGLRTDYSNFIGYRKFFQLSPKASMIYSPQLSGLFENSSFRFLVGKAFRTPSIAELYFKKELFGGFDFVFNPNLKPEEMVSSEIGIRKQFSGNLSIDLSAYINSYDNLIQYVNIGGQIDGPFQVQNIAKAQIKGIEIESNILIPFVFLKQKGNFILNLNYSLTDAKDLSPFRTDDYLPYKPKHLVNFNLLTEYSGFGLSLTGKYLSKTDEVIFFKYEEPQAYFVLDVKLTKKFSEKISAYIAVNNVSDKSYQELERIQAPNRRFSSGINIEF